MTTRTVPAGRRLGRRLAGLVCVAGIGIGGLTMADAATLAVNGGQLSTVDAGPCVQSVTVTRTKPDYLILNWILLGYEGVRVSGNLDGCRRREVLVRGTTGSPSLSGTVPASGSTTMDWDVARYATNREFVVTIDGWQIPATIVNV